ncbi:MAG: DUF6272 family protein [Bacteroidota bacterium]
MNIDLTKNIYDKMVSQRFVVSIMGFFDQQDLLLSLINLTEKKLTGLEVQDSIKKKIFHFMVECSQNLLKTEKSQEKSDNNLFLISQEGDNYTVYLGSKVDKNIVGPILETITEVNNINSEDIKKKYYDELTSKEIVNQNLILLSMLSITKKTKKKIEYEHISIDDTTSFLSFKMTITN